MSDGEQDIDKLQKTVEEQKESNESGEKLTQATKETMQVYILANLDNTPLGTEKSRSDTQAAWEKLAAKYPDYSNNINTFKERISIIGETQKSYPPGFMEVFKQPFARVEDRVAVILLGDVLASRNISEPGYLDYKKGRTEADGMAAELGVQGTWADESAKLVTAEKVMGSLIKGDLRTTYQAEQTPTTSSAPQSS